MGFLASIPLAYVQLYYIVNDCTSIISDNLHFHITRNGKKDSYTVLSRQGSIHQNSRDWC